MASKTPAFTASKASNVPTMAPAGNGFTTSFSSEIALTLLANCSNLV
jgi:hypothetical protein